MEDRKGRKHKLPALSVFQLAEPYWIVMRDASGTIFTVVAV